MCTPIDKLSSKGVDRYFQYCLICYFISFASFSEALNAALPNNLLIENGVNADFALVFNQVNCVKASSSCGLALFNKAVIDGEQSIHDDATGAIRLTEIGDGIETIKIPIEHSTYTFSGFMNVSDFPPPNIVINVRYYDDAGFLKNEKFVRWSTTDSNRWQELVYIFRPPENAASVKLALKLEAFSDNAAASVWIDNIGLSKGINFTKSASEKKTFDSGKVKVDHLGNISLFENGYWRPFFPRCIYADNNRQSWKVYAEQGFNCVMRAASVGAVRKAREAGLKSGFSLNWYMMPKFADTHPIQLLEKRLKAVRESGLMEDILWYYWDNENEITQEWTRVRRIIQKIRELDPLHPVYGLQGQEGLARKYNGVVQLTDIVGEYISDDLGYFTLDNIEGQLSPAAVAQFNFGVGEKFRPLLYTAIARGAKAIGYWKDELVSPKLAGPVEHQLWWNEFPQLVNEIEQLMPLIRQPHKTNWRVESSSNQINFGTRVHNDLGYIIVANTHKHEISATFEIIGLSYNARAVLDFFQGERISSIKNNTFSLSIPALGAYVLVLDKP